MKANKILFTILCCMLGYSSVTAETGNGLENVINNFNLRYPQEKVFLHFDNTAYYNDETIWWKAYVLRTDKDSLGSLSRVLYVELIDPSGEILATKKCRIENGTANGEFMLQRYAENSGFYQVRAYTRYMLNWGSNCVFSRFLPVFKQSSEKGDYSKPTISATGIFAKNGKTEEQILSDSSRYTVRFYPESGTLVRGLESRVAFEVTDGNGREMDASGWLAVGKDRKAQVSTLREGRGVFAYTPTDKKARLELTFPDGKTRGYDLPDAADKGFALTVDANLPDNLTWKAEQKGMGSLLTETLLVHNGKAKAVSSPLDRKAMPEGVSQLCLVDRNGAVLASRMVFNYPTDGIGNITITARDTAIYPDKEMHLGLKASRRGSVSMSVCDAETQFAADRHNAATWLLLSSDLKGYIRNPEYYFEADDSVHRRATDLLMLVQGWRRYDIEAMDGLKEWTKRYPVENQLLIDGRLKAYSRRNPVKGANLSIRMTSHLGSKLTGNVTTDSTGYYVFAVPDCWDTWQMLMHTTLNDKDKRYYITLNRHFSPEPESITWYAANNDTPISPDFSYNVDKTHMDSIPMSLRAHWLSEVDVEAKRRWRSPRDFWEDENRGAKYASIRYNMIKAADEIADQGEDMPTIVEWLEKKNPLIEGYDNVSGEERKVNLYDGLHGDGPTYGGKGIMWIVNGWFVCGTGIPRFGGKDPAVRTESDPRNLYVPYDISSLRSIYISTKTDDWKRFLVAPHLEAQGLVTIFAYEYGSDATKLPKGYRRTSFEGYSYPEDYKQFISLTGLDLAGADYRRTLYWNPEVSLDSDGKAEITFKNNSTSRHMTVSAMGFTKDGRPLIYKHK